MKNKKRLTQTERVEIVRRLQAGEKQADLAVEFGVSQSTINRVRTQEREKAKAEDPVDTSVEELQKQFWKKHQRYNDVLSNRNTVLRIHPEDIEANIRRYETQAKEAPTRKFSEMFKAKADACRLELVALKDLSDFDDEIAELISDLYTLSQVLCRSRKVGLGTTIAKDSHGNTL